MFRKRFPEKLRDLITRFEINQKTYTSSTFKEESVKIEFLNPFLRTFGWDVENAAGYSDEAKEIEFEKVYKKLEKRKKKSRFVDYAFKIGNQTKFILEAKKPSADIKSSIAFARQTRRYGAMSRSRIAVLSDFEEFSIYDCSIKLKQKDNASTARIFHCKYSDYPKYYNFLYALISKQAILTGLHDKILDDYLALKNQISSSYYTYEETNLLLDTYQRLDKQLISISTHERLELESEILPEEIERKFIEPQEQKPAQVQIPHPAILPLDVAEISLELKQLQQAMAQLEYVVPQAVANQLTPIKDLISSKLETLTATPIAEKVKSLIGDMIALKKSVELINIAIDKSEQQLRAHVDGQTVQISEMIEKLLHEHQKALTLMQKHDEEIKIEQTDTSIAEPEPKYALDAEREKLNKFRATIPQMNWLASESAQFYITPLFH